VDLRSLKYTPDHLWVKLDDDGNALIGLTEEGLEDYLELSGIRLPNEGDEFQKDQSFGRVSVAKSISFKLISPFAGEILAVNEDILDAPEVILEDPYEEGWLVKMIVNSMSEYDDLMTFDEYEQYLDDVAPDVSGDDDDDDDEDDDDDSFFDLDYDDDDEDEDEDEDEDDYYDDDDEEY
jgi:glycine cleavage system H protein